MTRLPILIFLSLALASASLAADPPNVVVLLADDLGYADLGVQGSTEVLTPNIDSIARDGIRFTDGYVTAPMCSPSRAGFITGRYQQRFGYDVNRGWELSVEGKLGLPEDEPTIAERLTSAGYRSGIIGKWDLGAGEIHHPNNRGFDYFYGFLGGSRHHPPRQDVSINTMLRNKEPVEETDWSSDIYGKEAAEFITRNRDHPFFLFVSFTAPHWPMEAKPEDMALFEHVEDLHRRTFLAMMAGLDRGVGMILDAIEENGLADDTLVIFLSDNGGATWGTKNTPIRLGFPLGVNTSLNDPFRGKKGTLLEGGIRVPFLARWPDVIEAGRVEETPVSALDIAATAVALADVSPDTSRPLDGIDLTALLEETGSLPDRPLFWRVKNQYAVRDGDWKLLQIGKNPPELYHLSEDPTESENLFDAEPEKAAALQALLDEWREGLVPPRW